MVYIKLWANLTLFVLLLSYTLGTTADTKTENESRQKEPDFNHQLVKRESNETKPKKPVATKKPTQLSKADVVKPQLSGSKLGSTGVPGEKLSTSPPHETTSLTSTTSSSASVTTNSSKAIPPSPTSSTYESSGFNLTDVSYDAEEPLKTPSNLNKTEDHHIYYNSTLYSDPAEAMKLWVDLKSMSEHVITHEMLSSSHRRAATVKLNFTFPFYGHEINNVTIATGGFMYLGETVHSWLAATQYIAPLMANFDTSMSNESNIQFVDTGHNFTVQWTNVILQDQKEKGSFTFQVTIKDNGDIVFVYKDVPYPVVNITDDKHPVKVGISDAYVVDKVMLFLRRKTIYEYHRIDFLKGNIDNNTAIYFTALPTCLSFKDCHSCNTAKISFSCKWCPAVRRCSTGYDRYRQQWVTHGCDDNVADATCTANDNTTMNEVNTSQRSSKVSVIVPGEHKSDSQSVPRLSYRTGSAKTSEASASKAGLLSFVVLMTLVASIGLWVFYAYRNPQTSSGQFLIKYRPAQWRLGGSEARYTAASIHM